MSAPFDPYYKWLGIPAAEQPPNCYRLLGVREFEDDPEVIEAAADQRSRHLRSFQNAKQGELSKKLLSEVAQARRRLLDPEEKAVYDAQLRERQSIAGQASRASFETPSRGASEGGKRGKTPWPEGKPPTSVEEFYQCLDASGALSVEESRKFTANLPDAKRQDGPKPLAAELVKAGKLTRFQAQNLLQGKVKYLSFGEYVVLDRIGQGGMGQVLKAEHRRMKRTVALKVISGAAIKDADAVRRFQREVHAAARLIHPNIVTAFDANEHEGIHFLVMEYVAGKDLGAVVKERGPLPVATAVDYVLQAARGLAYAHSKGIIHRDIKPGNLLVDGEGTVKILDMGLARMELAEESQQELTNTGQVMGTIDYMAPEQAEDTHSAGAPADIYSLGCTLYRLLTGDVLYGGETLMKKLLSHRTAPIPSLAAARPDVPPALEAIFQKMVAKRPEDRHASMAQVVSELEGILRVDRPSAASGIATEVTQDIKLSEFLSGLSPPGKKSGTAVAAKPQTKTAPHAEVTQDLKAGDTSPTALSAALAPVARPAGKTAAPAAVKPNRPPAAAKKKPPPAALWIAAGLAAVAVLAGTIVILLPTADGTIRIEINDPTIEVTVSETGYTIKGQSEEIHLKPGEHTLHVKAGDLEFDTQRFVLGKGENPPVRVELLPGKVQVVQANQVMGQAARSAAAKSPTGSTAGGTAARTAGGTAGPASNGVQSSGWTDLFNGRDLAGWLQKGHAGWRVEAGELVGESVGAVGWLMSLPEFDNFGLELEYKLPAGGNSGVFFRAPEQGNISGSEFHEIQLLDDRSPKFAGVRPEARTGSLFGKLAAKTTDVTLPNQWHSLSALVFNQRVVVTVDGKVTLDGQLPSDKPGRGHIGLQLYSPGVRFRNLRVRELNADGTAKAGAVTGRSGLGSSASPSVAAATGDFVLAFDGRDDIVRIDSLKHLVHQPLTVEAWVQPRSLGQLNTVFAISSRLFLQSCKLPGRPHPTWQWVGATPATLTFQTIEGPPLTSVPNQPVHLAGVYTGSELVLFVDGRRQTTPPILVRGGSGTTSPASAQFTLDAGLADTGATIGGQWDGSKQKTFFPFDGQIDEVRVSRIARYSADFTPARRFAPDGDTLALYHCDEGKGVKLTDYSGAGRHGAITGAKWVSLAETSAGAGVIASAYAGGNFALEFDDQTGMVEVPIPKLDLGPRSTIEAWMECKSLASPGNPIVVHEEPGRYLWLRTTSEDYNILAWEVGAEQNRGYSARPGPSIDQLHHLAIVTQGSSKSLYLDGKRVGLSVASGDAKGWGRSDFSGLLIGANRSPQGTPTDRFHGRIDELRISTSARYSGNFTPARRFAPDDQTLVLYHFNEGQGDVVTDYSGNGHHGKIVGANWVPSISEPRNELPSAIATTAPSDLPRPPGEGAGRTSPSALPGLGARVHVELPPLLKANDAFTVELFATPRSLAGPNESRQLWSLSGALELKQVAGNWTWQRNNRAGPGPRFEQVIAADAVQPGQRVHLAAVSTGTELRLFRDGKLVGAQKLSAPLPDSQLASSLGGGPSNNQFYSPFDGTIEEVRFSRGIRYERDFTPTSRPEPDAATLALYHGDVLQGDVLTDASGNGHHGKIKEAPRAAGPTTDSSDAAVARPGAAPAAPPATAAAAAMPALDFSTRTNPGAARVHLPLRLREFEPITVEVYATAREVAPQGHSRGLFNLGGAQSLKQFQERWVWTVGSDNQRHTVIHGPLIVGRRTHLAATKSATEIRLYVDGKLSSAAKLASQLASDTSPGWLGGLPQDSTYWSPFAGTMDEVRISRGVRYTADFTPPPAPFVADEATLALYHMDEGQGNELKDASGNGHHGTVVGAAWLAAGDITP